MSRVAISGNPSGAGTITIQSANTNSDYTLTLPAATGSVVVTGGAQTIEFAAGSASTPSITFTGDTNTGIFSPAADTVAIAAGGSNKAQFGTGSAIIDGLTVGRGAGAVATNTAVGASALANTSGGQNTALGDSALVANTTGIRNTGIGYVSLSNNTTGNYNTAVGAFAGDDTSTGSSNSFFGYDSGARNTSGSNNTALGASALLFNTTASYNTAVGYQAGYSNTTGAENTFGGWAAGYNVTTGTENTALGARSGGYTSASTGSYNTSLGSLALRNVTTGYANTALGRAAGVSITTGYQNIAIGQNAMEATTTANSNVAIGAGVIGSATGALGSNTTGNNNTAVGFQALASNTTAPNNTAVGYQAGYSNTTGPENTFIGFQAGYYHTTSGYNTFVGAYAGQSVTTGTENQFFGRYAGQAMTTGSRNTLIGKFSGNQGGLDIRTASDHIVLSDGAGNPRSWFGSGAGTNWACAKDDADITMYYGPANLTPNATRSARLGFITNSVNKNWYMAHSWITTGAIEFIQTTANGNATMGGTAAFTLNSSGNGIFTGSLSKGSGSFRIDHPLPQLEETHHLVHSFIEGPQADLIYRGKVNLVSGRAEVNIDLASGMTEGTFVALCRDVQCFTTNESDWVHVRGSVSGNVLTIEAQDQTATSLISWMVIGERQDKHMIDTDWTDDNGKVIVEPIKPPKIERTERTEDQS